MNIVTQLTQFVGRDVINKNTTDLAVRCSTGSVELCRYKHPFRICYKLFKIINGIDKVDKSLFFEIDSGGRRGHSSNYSKNVADLTLGNMHLVIALLTNGIL